MPKIIKLVGEIDSWGYMAWTIEDQLSDVKAGEEVELQIDSLGGDVAQGKRIQNMIKAQGNVTAHIVGYTASAATWIALGANKVVMNEDVLMLIHKTSNELDLYRTVNADDLDKIITDLQKVKKDNEAFDLSIAQTYVRHSNGKLDVKGAIDLMKDAAWLTPQEALKYGLIDEISNEKNMQVINNKISLKVMNSLKMPAIPKIVKDEEPEKKGVVGYVKEALTQFFGGAVSIAAPPKSPDVQTEKSNQIKVMNKNYVKVNTLLNLEGLDVQDGKVTLTEDQVKSINDALTDKETKIKDLQALAKTAEEALVNANSTLDTISDEVKSATDLKGKVDKVKSIMDKVAGVHLDTSPAENDPEDCSDIAKDPVNDMVAPYLSRNIKK